MKLLVTGGAGFIGSAVIRHIITNTNDELVNLDKLTYAGNLESLAEVSSNERYTFEQVDICNRAELDRVLAQHQPDAIMHLAAESHVDRSIDGPADFIETNIVGTYTLLEATRQYSQALEAEKKANFRFHRTDESITFDIKLSGHAAKRRCIECSRGESGLLRSPERSDIRYVEGINGWRPASDSVYVEFESGRIELL
ncbi:hypothetical protein Q673_11145 [Marinobacter sp. EN3]|nr:hypothetical protein Q673_11145 [Marinobacter sp. EN3]